MRFFLLIALLCTSFLDCQETKWLDQAIKPYMKEHRIKGISLVYFDGKESHFLNYGVESGRKKKVTKTTLYDIASITKTFTATALALRVQAKKMNLTDSIVKWIPELKGKSGFLNQVTLKNLATHTSGFPREFMRTVEKEEIVRRVGKMKAQQPIGTYVYSNLGFGILGYALEEQSHKSYKEIITDEILKPLKMTKTTVSVRNAWPASGAIRSNTEDMLIYLKANLGLAGDAKLTSAMRFTQKKYAKVTQDHTMGLGWNRIVTKKGLLIDKNGGHPGYSSYIGFFPERKIGIVILANKAKVSLTDFCRDLLRSAP